MEDHKLPTGLWVDGVLHGLTLRAVPFYIVQKGNHASGLVMLKLNGRKGHVKILQQERNFESGDLEWIHPYEHELLDEFQADQHIQRAIARDPDLWVVEIEDPDMNNPFV